MDAPAFDHWAWIADHEDRDAVHLDWSSLPAVDPGDRPEPAPDDPGDHDALVAAISSAYDVDREQVLATTGATEAVDLAVRATVADGGRVAVEHPAYQPLVWIPRLAGGEVVRFRRRSGTGYALPVDHILDLLEGGLDLVVLTNLHNPTGAGVDDDALRALAGAADDHDAQLLVDEVFRRSALGATADHAARFEAGVAADSLTKSFGYGTLRTGWMVGPPDVVDRARAWKEMVNPGIAGPGRTVAAWCLANEDEIMAEHRDRIERNRKRLDAWVDEHDLDWSAPEAGNVCTVEVGDDDVAFAERAVDAGVVVVPGSFIEMPGHVRIAYGMATDELERGLERLGSVV